MAISSFYSASGAYVTFPFTLHAWGRISDNTAYRNLIKLVDPVNGDEHTIGHDGVANEWKAYSFNGGSDYDTSFFGTNTVNNQWYSVCGIFRNNSNREVFVDNVSGGADTSFNAATGINTTYLNGGSLIDSFDHAIWSVALNSTERAMLAAGVSPLLVRPDKLVRYWDSRKANSGVLQELITGQTATSSSPAFTPTPRIIDGKIFLVPATAGGGSTVYPYGQQHLDRQFAGMAAAKLGGVLQ